jgi:predicted phage replisome organizer
MSVPWIKIRTDMFSDEKIRLIEALPEADGILVIWIKLLTLAGMVNMNGEIFVNDELCYTDEMLATIFNRKVNTIRMALKTFVNFRMIEIMTDKTIVVCNWSKHQNLEGLDKIRQQNLERKRRQRERCLEHRLMLREATQNSDNANKDMPLDCHVTRHVTARDSVTQDSVTQRDQNKIENKKEIKIPIPAVPSLGGKGQPANSSDEFITDIEEAKRLICERILNGKDPSRPWSDKAMSNLARLLPMPRLELERIAWFRGLPADGTPELEERKPVTETGLTEFWSDEVTRARAFWQEICGWRQKKTTPDNGWTLERKKAAPLEFPEVVRWPDRFDEIPVEYQRQIDKRVKEMTNSDFQTPGAAE